MPLPDFTDEEQYLINAVKLSQSNRRPDSFMWAYLLSSAGLGFAGTYYNNPGLAFTAVVAICCFRIYEEFHQSKWGPYWYSIITKFEEAARGTDAVAATNRTPDS